MRLVVPTEEGTVSINYTWLPTWIGMNNVLLTEIGEKISEEFRGKPLSDANLDQMNVRVATLLCKKLKIPDLNILFDALEKIEP